MAYLKHYRALAQWLDGFEKDCGISNTSAMEITQSCTKPSTWSTKSRCNSDTTNLNQFFLKLKSLSTAHSHCFDEQIILKFGTEHCSLTAGLHAKFPNDLFIEMHVMAQEHLMRSGFKINFKALLARPPVLFGIVIFTDNFHLPSCNENTCNNLFYLNS